MFKDIETLQQEIRAFGLQRHEEKILALAKPAIRMLPSRVDDAEIPIGSSKLGGMPDLPPNFQWKYYGGKPLTFIGQFKLSEIAPYDVDKELPETGILYFFFEADEVIDDFGAWEIFYVEDESTELHRRIHPKHKGEFRDIDALPSHSLSFESLLSIPRIIGSVESVDWNIEFNEDEQDSYFEFYESHFPSPRHSFLGHDSHIQHTPLWNCVVITQGIRMKKIEESNSYPYIDEHIALIEFEMQKWKFLFQIDTDNSLDVMWGDVGMLYICIHKDRLVTKQFGKCMVLMQCS